ncbi:MAG: nucleoside-specific outer membrane channel protein Tsx [Oleispira sp.]|jgi:nucleoside-specific outer membrane channel protein Tsx
MGITMNFTKLALATAMTVASGAASAATFFYDNSVSVLYGQDYEVGDSDRAVVTFEHFSAHSWGDIFVFADRLMDQGKDNEQNLGDGTETYIEVAPRFKVSDFDAGFVKNVYVATTWEMSEAEDNLLVGLGTDFNVPGFQNLSLNAYQRLNDNYENNYQTTLVWGVPFAIAGQNFMFDGFWDWATATDEDNKAATSNFTYQLKWDAAQALGTDNKVYVGIEHATWDNKFAIEHSSGFDTKENVVSALVKVHF